MKKRFPVILSAIACGLVILCLMQISDLKNQVNTLQNQLDNQNNQFSSQMAAFTNQVELALEAEASILSSQDYSLGGPNMETMTAPITFTATPKEHTPGVTTAALVVSGQTFPMTPQDNGSYTVTLDWPLFETASLERVTFQENGVQRSEAVSIAETPGLVLLNIPFAHEAGGTAKVEDGKLHYEMDIYVDNLAYSQGRDGNDAQSVALVALQDGQEIDRIDFDLNQMEQSGGTYNFWEAVQAKFDLPEGSTLTLMVEVTDDLGFTYHLFLNEYQGDGSQSAPLVDQFIQIYDAQGNLLWDDTYK